MQILAGLESKALKDYCKYLCIPCNNADTGRKMASAVIKILTERPEYLLYVLEKEQFQELVRFYQADAGIIEKVPKEETIEVWMMLGLVSFRHSSKVEGEVVTFSPVIELGDVLEPLLESDWKREYRQIGTMSESYALPAWRDLKCFLGHGDHQREKQLEVWMNALFVDVISGCSSTYLIRKITDMIECDTVFDWIQLWSIVMDICLTTNLAVLKGYSRAEFADLTGQSLAYVNLFDEDLPNTANETAHMYELSGEMQLRVFLNLEEGEENTQVEDLEKIVSEEGNENVEITFLYAMRLINAKRYRKARSVLDTLVSVYQHQDDAVNSLLQELDKEIEQNKNVIYRSEYGSEPYQREHAKIGRNAPCPCGSGKKYKQCCMEKVK